MVEKIFMSVKQKCDNALIMLFYKFIDGSKIIDEFGNFSGVPKGMIIDGLKDSDKYYF